MTRITITLLYPTLPELSLDLLARKLGGAVDRADGDHIRFDDGLSLCLSGQDTPLGGADFSGTIPQDTTPANRAALVGIISRHGAHEVIRITGGSDDVQTRQAALRLAHRASLERAVSHPPLALLWGPTGQLMQRAALEALPQDGLSLFIRVEDEALGPRNQPALRLTGARTWIGWELHARLGVLPREVVRRAALAFLTAAHRDPGLVRAQSYLHAGQTYRIAHAPENRRIDLIPAADRPLEIRPLPRAGLRRSGPDAASSAA